MKPITFVILLLLPTAAVAQGTAEPDSALARELALRVEIDQAVRELVDVRGGPGQAIDTDLLALWTAIDSLNTAWLMGVVAERGWPKRSRVGEEAAHDAWLLVQHADRDRAFQREVLELMEAAVAEGEASGSDFAYLTDRVRLAEGQPQLYGTQVRVEPDGSIESFPIEDPEEVDERRAAVGLMPLEEYLDFFRQQYGGTPKSGEESDR